MRNDDRPPWPDDPEELARALGVHPDGDPTEERARLIGRADDRTRHLHPGRPADPWTVARMARMMLLVESGGSEEEARRAGLWVTPRQVARHQRQAGRAGRAGRAGQDSQDSQDSDQS